MSRKASGAGTESQPVDDSVADLQAACNAATAKDLQSTNSRLNRQVCFWWRVEAVEVCARSI